MSDKKTLRAENEALRQRVRELERLVSEMALQTKPPTVINIPAPVYPTPAYPNNDWWKPRWYCSTTTGARSGAVVVGTQVFPVGSFHPSARADRN